MKRNQDEVTPIGLAKDVMAGQAMTSDQVPPELWPTVFMPLILMTEEQRDKLKSATLFFGYIRDAAPTAINGYPIFYTLYSWEEKRHKEFTYCIRKLLNQQEKLERRMERWGKIRKIFSGNTMMRIRCLIARLMKSLR